MGGMGSGREVQEGGDFFLRNIIKGKRNELIG